MTTLQAILLGIVQGLTEFLPVSSSGHLKLFQAIFGLQSLESYLLFDLVCHMGSLVAIVFFFLDEIKSLFSVSKIVLLQIAIALLPLLPLIYVMKPIKKIIASPEFLCFFFWITAFLLFLCSRYGYSLTFQELRNRRFSNPFIIGLFQALALFPGISRSGSTITAARLLGWNKEQAFSFSFLLAIPTIIGGTFLELLQSKESSSVLPDIHISAYLIAFILSFIVGFFALFLLKKMLIQGRLMVFSWYCIFIGMLSFWLFTL